MRPRLSTLIFGILALGAAGFLLQSSRWGIAAADLAEPTLSAEAAAAPVPAGRQVATLAGGCFWSMEAIFGQIRGVDRVESGYAGGKGANPTYEQVESGTTGYAESLQITFDPKALSYRDLLRIFFTVRDPTTPNRQGPDEGPQYRSVVFYRNAAQRRVAEQVMREIVQAHLWKAPLVTQLVPFTRFYPAEAYHRDYYRRHPDEPYCRAVIAPEIAAFRAEFKSRLKQ